MTDKSSTVNLGTRRAWVGVAALGLLGAGAVRAQMSGGMGGGMGGPGGGRGRPGGDCKSASAESPGPAGATLIKMAAGERLRSLPGELQLTPQQVALYARYAGAVEKIMLDEGTWASRPAPTEGSAMQRIGSQIDRASNRAAGWEEVLDAVKPLYASLSISQQAIADKRLVVSLEPNAWVFAKGDDAGPPSGAPQGTPPQRPSQP
ncbi:hypothetical protein [Rhodoferax sp. GW822-FHT02A01]|uniref:hypothetical protein n=1 Tax=Rhodoferax sp. GW822-FHT02A01 TaxID=3141537 RepID=UPI00315DD099